MNKNYNEIVVQQYHVLLSIKIFPRILVPSIPKKMGFCLFFKKQIQYFVQFPKLIKKMSLF